MPTIGLVLSWTPLAELFFLASVCVITFVAKRLHASCVGACFIGFASASFLHCMIWFFGPFGNHHWNQYAGVFYGELWLHPYYWTWIPFLIYWIVPWPLAIASYVLLGKKPAPNHRLQLTGGARE